MSSWFLREFNILPVVAVVYSASLGLPPRLGSCLKVSMNIQARGCDYGGDDDDTNSSILLEGIRSLFMFFCFRLSK